MKSEPVDIKHFKKWYTNTITSDIFNNRTYQSWGGNKLIKSFPRFFIFTKKNVDEFKQIFGKQTGTFIGEFRYYMWVRTFDNETFIVVSSNKGTSVEIVYDLHITNIMTDNEKGKKIIAFVNYLIDELEKVVDNSLQEKLRLMGEKFQ